MLQSLEKVSSSTSSFIKVRKLTITKKGKPGKAKTIGIEDVPDHAVDVVVVDGKIIKELRDDPEEGEEHVRKAIGNHEGTGSLKGFTIDNELDHLIVPLHIFVTQICVHLFDQLFVGKDDRIDQKVCKKCDR